MKLNELNINNISEVLHVFLNVPPTLFPKSE